MYQQLETYVENIGEDISNISGNRRIKLKQIAEYIQEKNESNETAKLTFICTHNSRRSHLCQIWAAVLADYFGLENIETFSGGTEATAFNPRAVAAIERAGFKVERTEDKNPYYEVYFNDDKEPLICFSKTFDDSYNPQEEFAAIMTCSDADENCPVIPRADKRFSIPYVDPKESDGTPRETQTYDERCEQIATEMYYLMSKIN